MLTYIRRKFRSQTSDNMDRWKSRGGKSQRREEQKREDQRRERVRRKKMQGREKVGKSRNTVFFQWFVAPEGWKVGLLKRRVRSCGAIWPDERWKVARRCGAKHISKSTVQKTEGHGALSNVQMSFCMAGAGDCAPCQKWAKREGFVAVSKTMAGVGHLKRICKDACRVADAIRKTCSPEMLGGQGADFLRGVAFWSVRSSGLLRWFCLTGAALRMTWHHFFVAGAAWSGKIAKRIGTRPPALHSTFHFWRKSRRIALFLMLSTWKIEEVSQNSFLFRLADR